MSNALISEYKRRKPKIKARLRHYYLRGLHASNQDIFEVMCLCICSPQTDYKAVTSANEELKRCGLLLSGSPGELALCLKKHKVRFQNRKAKYIVRARDEFVGPAAEITLEFIISALRGEKSLERRERLREILRGFGLGMKVTSEFLRNLGLGADYAILVLSRRNILALL